MNLWVEWMGIVMELRPAFTRQRTFYWFVVCLIGMSVRTDTFGVSSLVRILKLEDHCYDRILDFFHSTAGCPDRLAKCWLKLVIKFFPSKLTVNGRLLLVGDGIKVPKSGRKMPSVKYLHQQSGSNTKPEYIMGHSFQALGILAGGLKGIFAVPLISRIHEGVNFSPRKRKTLLDKMIGLVQQLEIEQPAYLIVDAYYASGKLLKGMIEIGVDIITRVKDTTVAYYPPNAEDQPKGRGRKRTYGKKVKLKELENPDDAISIDSPIYGEKGITIKYLSFDLLWKPAGAFVRFVIVFHPVRGTVYLLTTDLSLAAEEVVRLYGLRFKIELSFKQIIRILGGYSYRFWMKAMTPLKRKSKDQFLHRKPQEYRESVIRKIRAYHMHVQVGIIAQGMMHYLALHFPAAVWSSFGSWMRTMKTDMCPSEFVVASALRNTYMQFLLDKSCYMIFKKFLADKTDWEQSMVDDLAA